MPGTLYVSLFPELMGTQTCCVGSFGDKEKLGKQKEPTDIEQVTPGLEHHECWISSGRQV